MTTTLARGSFSFLLLVAAACGDDTGGGGGAGGAGAGGSSTSTTSTATAAGPTSTGVTSSTGQGGGAGGDGGSGGEGPAPVRDPLPYDEACEGALPAEEDLGAGPDPEAGDFTLEEALAGLPEGEGELRAVLDTDHGRITCTFFPDDAPNGVANFIGLARGLRPWEDPDTDTWVRGRRFYDGLIFHRVIDDFIIQGGDPLGTGYGGPGYSFDDEVTDLSHVPGTLAYANSGPDTNGSQFYVVAEEPAGFLDGDYTIFGLCSPITAVDSLSEVATDADDAPLETLTLHRVAITRCAP